MKKLISEVVLITILSLLSIRSFSQDIKNNNAEAKVTANTNSEPVDSNRIRIWDKISGHLTRDLKFPQEAINAGIRDTTVYVSAVIREDGNIVKVKVRKPVGYGFDEEALRVILAMRDFQPVIVDGQPMAVKLLIPVRFKLDQKANN